MLNNVLIRSMQAALLLVAAFIFAGCESRPPITHFDAQTQATNAAAPLVLHEGDTVKIAFPGAPKLDSMQIIRRDGKITLDIVGEVRAAGLTPHELEQELLKLYDAQLVDKEVTVSVPSSMFSVYVTGAVLHSGKLISERPLTPLQAVLEAGIDTTRSDLKRIIVIRTTADGATERYKVDLHKVVKLGAPADPLTLKPLDVIYVPEKFSWL
ncbi:MAG TPA: polysaccharide biosynthesis/export family protein [Verrucomicrobiae bacterium]|jgi:protein involved in polysaccharide export with SLBB domain